jgi:hypothetical protein
VKTPKHPTNTKVNFSLILSILGFLLSGFGLWYNSLRGADVKASLAGPISFNWTGGLPPPVVPPPPPNSPVPEEMMVLATINFANNGAQTGEIKALTLELRDDKDGTRWVFIPMMQVTDEEGLMNSWLKNHLRDAEGKPRQTPEEMWQSLDKKGVMTSLHTILLPGKQTTSQTYFFRAEHEVSTNMVLGPPHTFAVTLYTLSAGDNEFRAQDKGTLILTVQTMKLISTSGTTISVGFDEGRAFQRTFK